MTRKMTTEEHVLAQSVLDVLAGKTNLYTGPSLVEGCGRVNADDNEGVSVWLEKGGGYSLPDDSVIAKVQFDGMYDWDMPRVDGEYGKPVFSFEVLEALSKVFGSKKINVGSVEGGGGCESCGYGGHYQQEIFIHDAKPVNPFDNMVF